MSDLTGFIETAIAEPVVYVVGSGISIPFPSCLPSASDMIELTLRVVAPGSANHQEKQAVSSALPELFYEGLHQVAGDHAVGPWKLLRPENQPSGSADHAIGPNLGHLAIVYLAWRHGIPIVTPNFDLFFESAADVLGLNPVVAHPDSRDGYRLASSEHDQVAIWKVHGSVATPSSIRTTLQRITQYDHSLITNLRGLLEDHRSCLLAYSGRDVDLFPFIASFAGQGDHRPVWICEEFGPDHAVHSCPDRFETMKARTGQLARALLRCLTDESEPADRLRSEAERRTGRRKPELARDRGWTDSTYRADFVANELAEVFQVPGNRQLAFGISLHKVDRFSAAKAYLEHALERLPRAKQTARAQAHLYLSSSNHNLSKYERAESHAVRAEAIASEGGCRRERLASLAQRDEALRMQYLPRLGTEDWRNLLNVGAYWTVFRFVVDAVPLYRGWRRSKGRNDSNAVAIGNSFAEHLIRLLAVLQGGLESLPLIALFRRLLKRAWKRLRGFSHRIGYAAGVGNTQKYLVRLGEEDSRPLDRRDDGEGNLAYEILSAERVFNYMSHRHAVAIVARDRAERHRSEGNFDQAIAEYERCVEKAHELHNRSLELKGYLGMARLGEPVDCARIRKLLEEIEGEGYSAREDEILEYAGCEE